MVSKMKQRSSVLILKLISTNNVDSSAKLRKTEKVSESKNGLYPEKSKNLVQIPQKPIFSMVYRKPFLCALRFKVDC
jgi:hypothetical protein